MDLHPVYGPSLPEQGWVPAPRYLLRRDLVLERLSQHPQGKLLEIGTGPAVLLYELVQQGWQCTGLEQSEQALKIARNLHAGNETTQILDCPANDWLEQFDWLLAMEVLEHIEDDAAALSQWREWLVPGGRILLSVPAHQKKWNASDVWAGHYRRYERAQLESLFSRVGFEIESLCSYGFPLATILEPVRAKLLSRQMASEGNAGFSKREGSDQSGVKRTAEKKFYSIYSGFLGVNFMRFAFMLQRLFLETDIGNGYFVQARRKD